MTAATLFRNLTRDNGQVKTADGTRAMTAHEIKLAKRYAARTPKRIARAIELKRPARNASAMNAVAKASGLI